MDKEMPRQKSEVICRFRQHRKELMNDNHQPSVKQNLERLFPSINSVKSGVSRDGESLYTTSSLISTNLATPATTTKNTIADIW